MCLLARTHVSSSHDKNCESRFWSSGGNENYLFYCSAKSRRELKIKTLGVIFRGASAYYMYVQTSIACPKWAVCRIFGRISFRRKFLSKILAKKIWTPKSQMSGIVWKAFSKVWGQTEPYSRGKRLFKVLQKLDFLYVFGVEKWNVGDRLKLVFPKFQAEWSHPRGVNSRSKFCTNFRNDLIAADLNCSGAKRMLILFEGPWNNITAAGAVDRE